MTAPWVCHIAHGRARRGRPDQRPAGGRAARTSPGLCALSASGAVGGAAGLGRGRRGLRSASGSAC